MVKRFVFIETIGFLNQIIKSCIYAKVAHKNVWIHLLRCGLTLEFSRIDNNKIKDLLFATKTRHYPDQ